MVLEPDSRWRDMIGGVSPEGLILPMTIETLQHLADEHAEILEGIEGGPAELLDTARGLLVQAWFKYELLVQACLVSLQAVEAAVRQHYPGKDKVPLRTLVELAEQDGFLTVDSAQRLREAGIYLRNRLSHPDGQATLTIGFADPVIRTSHVLVRELAPVRQQPRP